MLGIGGRACFICVVISLVSLYVGEREAGEIKGAIRLAWLERTHHEGNGSDWFRLVIREPSEWVSWTRRWRDCSRVLIWSGDGVVIFFFLPFPVFSYI